MCGTEHGFGCCQDEGEVFFGGSPVIGQEVANFELEIFHEEQIKKPNFSHFRGKWVVLFFYPADFTFVCPTELQDLARKYEAFQKLNVEILSVSTDTVFAHKAWHDTSEAIKEVQYPMVADPTGNLTREFGVYIEEEGVARRGTFIIDPDGVLQAYEVHANNIGRSADELLRKIESAQFVREHGGEVCPANWKPGAKTLTPGLDLVGKI
jgi:peroxiredoxin (alkyl hydroperoxide reductase subunit C)